MSFQSKTDYCGLGREGLVIVSSDDEGRSGSVVSAMDDKGSIAASTYVDGGAAPKNAYDLKGEVPFTLSNQIKLGKLTNLSSNKYMLTDVAVSLSNAAAPTLSAAAAKVESGATEDFYYIVPTFTIPQTHHAAMLFSEATVTGSGCYLQSVNYAISAKANIVRDELGVEIASSLSAGLLTATLEINQTGSTAPTITAGSGWTISSPLTRTNPKSNYPTYKVTLINPLVKQAAVVGG